MLDELLTTEISDTIIRVANFRAASVKQSSVHPDDTLAILMQLDHDLQNWVLRLPSSWRYETQRCNPQDRVQMDFYHDYPGFSIASVWNQYRIARCLVNNDILTTMNELSVANMAFRTPALMEQYYQAQKTIQDLCTDIYASTAYFLGRIDQSNPQKPGVGVLEIMWSLYVCARMTQSISREQCFWAIRQLEAIGHEMGVRQAISLANSAKSMVNDVEMVYGESDHLRKSTISTIADIDCPDAPHLHQCLEILPG
jgi:hypothetical protein